MLFVTYWEVNPNFDAKKIAEVAAELTKTGAWPIEGTKVHGWYITPEGWGITIMEAENEKVAFKSANIWRHALPGIFTEYKSSVALTAKEAIAIGLEL